MKRYYIALMVSMSCNFFAGAIAVDDLVTAEANPTNVGAYADFNWDYVYRYKGSSSVAVDSHWLLTAAHVADDGGSGALSIGEETYTQMQRVFHPTADLALVRYDRAFPGFYPLAVETVVGAEVVVVGYGRQGNVVSTFFDAYFTETGTAHSTKRWGTNRIDQKKTYPTTQPIEASSLGFQISISRDRSSESPTNYEAGCNVYDSGCGLFLKEGGVWKLGGSMILREGTSTTRFTRNGAVDIASYSSWISDVLNNTDSDNDGMPDHFEQVYGGGSDLVASGDADGDGQSNVAEWVADTDPTDAGSVFTILDGSSGAEVVFSSVASREYQVQFRTNLVAGSWVETNAWLMGDTGSMTVSVPTNSVQQFTRMGVRIP